MFEPEDGIWTEGETPPPVSDTNPLVGLEVSVMDMWLQCSAQLRRIVKGPPAHWLNLANAARLAVHAAIVQERSLQAGGMPPHQAQEFTRPAMWAPPKWPST